VRLYLSSFRLGDHPDRLLTLLHQPAGCDVAVIANAVDALSGAERSAAVRQEAGALVGLGLRPSEVDLRLFFDRPSDIAAELRRFPLVWLRGGNVFMLRHALARSGADAVLVDLLSRDALVYAGYSAGACVLAPSLHGLEHCDDPGVVPGPVDWDGLGVLDRALVPHIDSPDHPESKVLGEVAAAYRAADVPYLALRDGQALVIDGSDGRVV
jgi:dipeptidase E